MINLAFFNQFISLRICSDSLFLLHSFIGLEFGFLADCLPVIAVTALEVNIAGRVGSRQKKKKKTKRNETLNPHVGARHWGIKHVVRTTGTDGRTEHSPPEADDVDGAEQDEEEGQLDPGETSRHGERGEVPPPQSSE